MQAVCDPLHHLDGGDAVLAGHDPADPGLGHVLDRGGDAVLAGVVPLPHQVKHALEVALSACFLEVGAGQNVIRDRVVRLLPHASPSLVPPTAALRSVSGRLPRPSQPCMSGMPLFKRLSAPTAFGNR